MKNTTKLTMLFCILAVFLIAQNVRGAEVIYDASDETECFPEYECATWGACVSGLSARVCEDRKCGERDIIERKICDENLKCRPEIKCGEWGTCIYSEKVNSFLEGEIKFTGYKERECSDTNKCVSSFIEEMPCYESYKLDILKKEICGKVYLSAVDSASKKQVALIDLESWQGNKLDILFTEGKSQYCPSCYNGIKDKDEGQIDCGGSCAPCAKITGIPTYLPQIILWALTFSFLAILIFRIASRKKK